MSEPETPQGYTFPTEAEYSSSLILAVDSMQPAIGVPISQGGIITPVMQAQVTGLMTALQSAAGTGTFGELVSLASDIEALARADTPIEIVNAIGALVETGVELASDTVDIAANVLDVASEAINIIPIVGQVVGAVFKLVSLIVDAFDDSAEREQEKIDCYNLWDEGCRAWITSTGPSNVRKTGTKGDVTPADNFRLLAYSWRTGSRDVWTPNDKLYVTHARAYHYPANTSTLILMLCGGAGRTNAEYDWEPPSGIGLSETCYQEIIKSLGVAGLSYETRARLWKLVRAVMSSVQDPNKLMGATIGDQGRAAGPLMMDILRTGREKNEIGGPVAPGAISLKLLQELGRAAFKPMTGGNCHGKYWHDCNRLIAESLALSLWDQIFVFNQTLKDPALGFWNNDTQKWIDAPKVTLAQQQAAGLPAMSKRPAMKMTKGVTKQTIKLLGVVGRQKGVLTSVALPKKKSGGGGGLMLLGGAILGFLLLRKKR